MNDDNYPESIDYGWRGTYNHAHVYLLPVIEKMISILNLSTSAKILDAGCGSGFILNHLQSLGHCNVWGFDPSPSGIEVARKTLPVFGNLW